MNNNSNKEAARPVQGLGEVSQKEIEERALKLAKSAGREEMNADDLSEAQKQILGKSPDEPAKTDKKTG